MNETEFGVVSQKEQFNTGAGYYMRLNELLTQLAQASIIGNKHNQYQLLFALYKAIRSKCSTEEKNMLDTDVKEVTKMLHEKYNGNATKIPDNILTEWELCMTELMEKHHMLTPKGDDPGAALSRGGF